MTAVFLRQRGKFRVKVFGDVRPGDEVVVTHTDGVTTETVTITAVVSRSVGHVICGFERKWMDVAK